MVVALAGSIAVSEKRDADPAAETSGFPPDYALVEAFLDGTLDAARDAELAARWRGSCRSIGRCRIGRCHPD
jgi:hypothetical protein